jgi:hypothetical protein
VAVATLGIVYGPPAASLGLVPLPVAVLLSLAAISAGYVVVTELAKAAFYRTPSGAGGRRR